MMPQTIEEILKSNVTYKDKQVQVKTLPLEVMLDLLIRYYWKVFSSPASQLWRLENLYFIIDKNARKVSFKLNYAQADFYSKYVITGFQRLILLKARQLGFTTFSSILFLDEIIFNPNTEALMIAHTVQDAKEIFNRKIRYAINNLPAPILKLFTLNQAKASRVEFQYTDKSTSAISVSGSGRSGTFHNLHVSELAKLAKAYPDRAREVITGTFPAVPMGGRIIIESTAEGMSGEYYDIFMPAWKKRDTITKQMTIGQFYPVFYNWTWDKDQIKQSCINGIIAVSEMQESEVDWAEYQKENNLSDEEMTFYYIKYLQSNEDLDKLHQEFPTNPYEAFIGSGSNFFSLKKTAEFLEACTDEYTRYSFIGGELKGDSKGDLWIKEDVKQERKYVLSGDVAQGLLEGDYSTFFVFGYDKKIKAFYRGHIEPDDYSKLVRVVGEKFNNALLVIESNADGNWVNTDITNHNYPNIFLRTSFDDITRTMTRTYGWRTDSNSRKMMLDSAKVYFNHLTELDCKPLLNEIMTFVRNKRGKPQAQSGKHDDLVMAFAIGCAVLQSFNEVVSPEKNFNIMEMLYYK